jgi:hypothetical protein
MRPVPMQAAVSAASSQQGVKIPARWDGGRGTARGHFPVAEGYQTNGLNSNYILLAHCIYVFATVTTNTD